MNAQQASELALAHRISGLSEALKEIRIAAEGGHFSLNIYGKKMNHDVAKKLTELGFVAESKFDTRTGDTWISVSWKEGDSNE